MPWTAYQSRQPTEAEVRRWFMRPANISIVTGRVSGLLVIDIDPLHGGDESAAEHLRDLPDTVRAITGSGGTHIYLRHPGDREIPNRTGIWPGVDIRADGGQVIAPPSLHASGRHYDWEAGLGPDEVGLAPAPAWLLEVIEEHGRPLEARSFDIEAALAARVREGGRHNHMVRIAGHLIATNRDRPLAALAQLREANARCCQPPLPEAEIITIFETLWAADRRREAAKAAVAMVVPPSSGPVPVAPALAEEMAPGQRAELLRALFQPLGLPAEVIALRRVIGHDEAQWVLVLEGGQTVALGSDVRSQQAVGRAILNQLGVVIPPMGRDAWLSFVGQAVALAEAEEALPPGPQQFEEWAAAWFDARPVVDLDEVGREIGHRQVRDGAPVLATVGGIRYRWISVGRLAQWLEVSGQGRYDPRVLAGWAKRAGWERAALWVGNGGVWLWRKPCE